MNILFSNEINYIVLQTQTLMTKHRKKLTHQLFVEKANKQHESFFDYIEQYINSYTKIKIKCPIHGIFEQMPSEHLRGRGCKQCSIIKEKTRKTSSTKEFINKSETIHGKNTYDYSLVEYVNNKTKVKITCSTHGVFETIPQTFLRKKSRGCKYCFYNSLCGNTKTFIEKAKNIHDNKYDYSLVNYDNNLTKIKIICPIHGIFEQTPSNHLNNFGCMNCGGKANFKTKSFIKKAKKTHGEKVYDYSLVKYVNIYSKIKIICPEHGIFKQTPHNHLQNKGCKKCSNITTKNQICLKKELEKLLENKEILLEKSIKIRESNRTIHADIFIPEKNVIIEYYGDYWHCNPKKYKSNYYNQRVKKYARDIWTYDNQRKQELEKLGYKVFIVWEKDFKTNKKHAIFNLINKIKEI